MRWRRGVAVLAAAAATTALGAAAPAAALTNPAAPLPEADTGAAVSVTLITGDRVTYTDKGVSVQRGPGREKVLFVGRTSHGHRYVFPIDALPLVEAGRLDQRLFDLTALKDYGYTGDARLPLILRYAKSVRNARAVAGKARVTRNLTGLRALAVDLAQPDRAEQWTTMVKDRNVERIYLDGKRKVNLDVSVPQIGAPAAWTQGLDGTGVTVAVLDSGIDATHPDLAGKIVATENFTSTPSADDEVGHGTHVASIIAGSGARSGGRYKGVAPGAKLAVGKVCGTEFCDDSAVLAGMEWGAQVAPVVNMSLGGFDAPGIDPLEQAVEDLTAAHGALFVVAAGNDGPGDRTLGSPGSADAALTVGAVDDQDRTASFSSRGPRVGDGAIKPDITGPGVNIVAAAAANGSIGTPAGDGYVSLNGTSMATPHVAGAAAIVTQQHPGWSPRQRKTLLMGAARPTAGASVFEQGAGRVDVAQVVRQSVSVDEGSVGLGVQRWPHGDDTPVTKTLTYRNGGSEPVTLALTLDTRAKAFGLGASGLTVPAGGTATTTVTADTRVDEPDGVLSGWVVATAGAVRVKTPITVNREVESYDVTFRHLGRDGADAGEYYTSLTSFANGEQYHLSSGRSAAVLRLPKGEYGMYSVVFRGNTDVTLLVQPTLVVDGAATVELDARRGKPVVITPPRQNAMPVLLAVNAAWYGEHINDGVSMVPGPGRTVYLAQVGGGGRTDVFSASINSAFAAPGADGTVWDSPYTVDASYLRKGSFYNGFVKDIDPRTLATVKAKYRRASTAADVFGYKINYPELGHIGGWASGLPFHPPFARTELVNTDGPIAWSAAFSQEQQPDPHELPVTLDQSYQPAARLESGEIYRQDWNRAVFAPSVAGDVDTAVRDGDRIRADVMLFSDGSGHLGWSRFEKARTALYSGDTLIGETDDDHQTFEVPAGAAPYRLEMSAVRGVPHRLSTSVSASWTFTSGSGRYRLPLSTVRFSPKLDTSNAAPAGAFTVPVTVERPTGSEARPNRLLTAEFSTDDGRSWQPARVTGSGDHRSIKVTNQTGGYLSLRVHTIDAAGNTAAITVLRAYAVN